MRCIIHRIWNQLYHQHRSLTPEFMVGYGDGDGGNGGSGGNGGLGTYNYGRGNVSVDLVVEV